MGVVVLTFEGFGPGDAVVVVDGDDVGVLVDEGAGVDECLEGCVVGESGESHVEGSMKGEHGACPLLAGVEDVIGSGLGGAHGGGDGEEYPECEGGCGFGC